MAETWTVGGTTSGYWAMGSLMSRNRPRITVATDSMAAPMGRSIKKRENMAWSSVGSGIVAGSRWTTHFPGEGFAPGISPGLGSTFISGRTYWMPLTITW